MKNNLRIIALIIFLGSLWGFSEIFIGSFLADQELPYGIIMTGFFAMIFLTMSRLIYNQRGIQLGIGLVAGSLKYFNPFVGCNVCSAIAIMAEGLIFELIWNYFINYDFSKFESLKLKILNWYLLRELLGPFLISLLTFSTIMLMGRTMKLSDLFVNKGIGILDILSLLTYILIPFLVYIIPMSLLLTILLALGRLSSDGEIIAMKSSGISLYQLAFPIVIFSSIAFLLTTALTLYAYPWGFSSLRKLAFKLAKNQSEVGIQERIFNDDFEGMIIYVDKTNVKGKKMQGVFISDKRDPNMSTSIIAKEGYISSDPESMVVNFRLLDGTFHRIGQDIQSYQTGNFNSYDINLDLTSVLMETKRKRIKYREMSIAALKDAIANSSLEEKDCIVNSTISNLKPEKKMNYHLRLS